MTVHPAGAQMNQGTDTQTDLAVDATAGEVLSSRQKIETAKYFSSSCGSLSSSDDIWGYPDTASQDTHMTERLETEPTAEYLHFPQKQLQETLSFNRQKILILNASDPCCFEMANKLQLSDGTHPVQYCRILCKENVRRPQTFHGFVFRWHH